MPDSLLRVGHLLGSRHDVQTRLIDDDSQRLDPPSRQWLAKRAILDPYDAMFVDRAIQRREDPLLLLVTLGRYSQHMQHFAVTFVMIHHRLGQLFPNLVPKRFDADPEARARQWVEQVAAEREGDEFRGTRGDSVGPFRLGTEFPNLASGRIVVGDVDSRRLERFQIASHAPSVERGEPQFLDEVIAQFLESLAISHALEDLQDLVLTD